MSEHKSQVWRVNVREQTLKQEPIPQTWQRLGGRGLLARILVDEVDATCDPLDAGNKLIFCLLYKSPSPRARTSSRMSSSA